jgi:hypothetical protein
MFLLFFFYSSRLFLVRRARYPFTAVRKLVLLLVNMAAIEELACKYRSYFGADAISAVSIMSVLSTGRSRFRIPVGEINFFLLLHV